MARITKWIGSNGEVLLPTELSTDNSKHLISSHGNYFIPIFEVIYPDIVSGNPIGLLFGICKSPICKVNGWNTRWN